jgi:hypothetical protein
VVTASREDPGDLAAYLAAFDQIEADPHQLLTTDTSRSDVIRFYEQLGFVASHEAMKLEL